MIQKGYSRGSPADDRGRRTFSRQGRADDSASTKTLTWFWDHDGGRDPDPTRTIPASGGVASKAGEHPQIGPFFNGMEAASWPRSGVGPRGAISCDAGNFYMDS